MNEETNAQPSTQPSDTPQATIEQLRFEHVRDTLGLDVARPRLTWFVQTDAPNWHQAAYEIEAYGSDGQLRTQTGRTESAQSALVAWPFEPLQSRERLTLRVRVWGVDGQASAWSESASVEAALLNPGDWTASFVTPDWDEDTSVAQPAPFVRRTFGVRSTVAQARLYITALGLYEAQINGVTVGDHVMAPGWTSYNHRLRYQTFDVTQMLRPGPNAIGAILGDGWYRGRLGFEGGRRNIYGDRLALLAQLEISYADGSSERIVSDEHWRAARGPITTNDIYDGETYDARLEMSGWSTPEFDDNEWAGVRILDREFGTLFAPTGPPVRRTEERAPVSISPGPTGKPIVDFGQNLVGRLRITVQGPAGHTITLRHAEVLENGELCVRPLRRAAATDRYTLRGDGVETWEPRFTFHGFRYAEIVDWPGELKPDDLSAIVCHSDMERTGWFSCSDALINRLHENVVWGMRGNFLDVPTDCPQRDERMGWTGDIQVFSPTACFLYDAAGFLQSWLADLAAEQENGVVPFVVPNVIPGPIMPAAAWGDAAVVVPWVLYQRFGDTSVLQTQFESMRAWVDAVAEHASPQRLWNQGFQFGDWLDPSAPPERPGDARADRHLVATAYFARSAELVGQAAGVLGRKEDEAYYHALAGEVRAAFAREYVTPAGRMLSDAATAYALALAFGLLPDQAQREHAAQRLAALMRENGYRISTGFVGTPLICDALCDAGQHHVAYRLLMERECPSWLYPVTMDATTIWERWDSLMPDGSVNPGGMTSFNHYALGAVADWMHRTAGGLAPAAPGYQRIDIQPRPGGGLTHATARLRTLYGLAESAWNIQGANIEVTATVPPNTTARVTLPGSDQTPFEVGSGQHQWSYPYQDPDFKPLTLDNPVSDFTDNPEAWSIVATTLQRLFPNTPFIGFMLRSYSDLSLRAALGRLPNTNQAYLDIESGLEALGR